MKNVNVNLINKHCCICSGAPMESRITYLFLRLSPVNAKDIHSGQYVNYSNLQLPEGSGPICLNWDNSITT